MKHVQQACETRAIDMNLGGSYGYGSIFSLKHRPPYNLNICSWWGLI